MNQNNTHLFEQHRRTLEGLAYRMLGTLAEAQDAVQETYLRWHSQDIDQLENHKAWLITVCSRICLNHLNLAYKQREVYVGEWLPEPSFQEFNEGLDVQLEVNETLTMTLLHALETLTPTERAVFLLHDIFDMGFSEIAPIVDKSVSNCRQLASRARKHIQQSESRFTANTQEHRKLLEGFVHAIKERDLECLISVLHNEVELYSDGGGKVEALSGVMTGNQHVAKFLVRIFSAIHEENIELQIRMQSFNGSIGILVFENRKLATVMSIDCTPDRILRIFAVRNPDKLENIPEALTV